MPPRPPSSVPVETPPPTFVWLASDCGGVASGTLLHLMRPSHSMWRGAECCCRPPGGGCLVLVYWEGVELSPPPSILDPHKAPPLPPPGVCGPGLRRGPPPRRRHRDRHPRPRPPGPRPPLPTLPSGRRELNSHHHPPPLPGFGMEADHREWRGVSPHPTPPSLMPHPVPTVAGVAAVPRRDRRRQHGTGPLLGPRAPPPPSPWVEGPGRGSALLGASPQLLR